MTPIFQDAACQSYSPCMFLFYPCFTSYIIINEPPIPED